MTPAQKLEAYAERCNLQDQDVEYIKELLVEARAEGWNAAIIAQCDLCETGIPVERGSSEKYPDRGISYWHRPDKLSVFADIECEAARLHAFSADKADSAKAT